MLRRSSANSISSTLPRPAQRTSLTSQQNGGLSARRQSVRSMIPSLTGASCPLPCGTQAACTLSGEHGKCPGRLAVHTVFFSRVSHHLNLAVSTHESELLRRVLAGPKTRTASCTGPADAHLPVPAHAVPRAKMHMISRQCSMAVCLAPRCYPEWLGSASGRTSLVRPYDLP